MARARNIKPSIMDNEELATLPALTRLLFIYMWMLADREGRLEDRPARIKKQALGYDDGSADEMLNELSRAGFIDRYEVAGAKVIQILAFNKHQTPHIREAASELPCKDASTTKEVPSTSLGSAEALPRSPDTPYLIPDTPYLIPEGESAARKPPAKRATPTPAIAKPDDVDPQTWADWCQLRKAKRATVSLTVIDGARDEAAKAGMSLESFLKTWCRRGSQGLEAEWLKPNERPQAAVQPVESFAERDERRARERIAEATGTTVKQPNDMGMVIDITPQRISA